jgi:hypothetical protein
MATCAKQPSPYLKRLEATCLKSKMSLTDTSFQILDELLHRVVGVSPSNIMITRLNRNIQKNIKKLNSYFYQAQFGKM